MKRRSRGLTRRLAPLSVVSPSVTRYLYELLVRVVGVWLLNLVKVAS